MAHVIYVLKCPRTLRVRYVGVTKRRLLARFNAHIADAKRSNSNTAKRCWIRDLIASGTLPVIEVIEHVEAWNWQDREKYWIAEFGGVEQLFNLTRGGDGGYVGPMTEAHKRSISMALKGRVFSAEHCANVSKAKKGRPFTAEHRAKLSAAKKGRPFPGKRGSWEKGRRHTAESRAKMSAATLGVSRGPLSEAHRQRISQGLMGRLCPKTQEHRNKISASLKGRKVPPFSELHRARLSDAAKRQWAARRAACV